MIIEVNKVLRWFKDIVKVKKEKNLYQLEKYCNDSDVKEEIKSSPQEQLQEESAQEIEEANYPKVQRIIYKRFEDMKLGPSLVIVGVKSVSERQDKGWVDFVQSLLNLDFFINDYADLIGIYEISDAVLGPINGITCTVLEFSKKTKFNKEIKDERNENYIKWPDEFKRDCKHWFLSGNI